MENKQKKEFECLTIGDVKKIYENLISCQNINKIEWTEEDEEIFEEVCGSIKYAEKHRKTCSKKLAKLQLEWFNSLKQRIGG